MTTIIYAHPYEGSFNNGILKKVVETHEKKGKKYQIIDLNKEDFNPVFTKEELALFSQGRSNYIKVLEYQEYIKNSDELVFIFPIWWSSMPAILKGFLDKVLLEGFAYTVGKSGLKGRLKHIKKSTVITTADSPKWYIRYIIGSGLNELFKGAIKGSGIAKAKWLHIDFIKGSKEEKREKFLNKVEKRFV